MTEPLASSRSDGISHGKGTLTTSPDTLIRTMDGHITSWPPDMERRYGFTSSEALGCTSHQLLRTTFPQALPEIEATLACQKTWSGVLIHRHADGRAVMTVNHWYVHQDIGKQTALVTEVHSNIAQEGKRNMPSTCRRAGGAGARAERAADGDQQLR